MSYAIGPPSNIEVLLHCHVTPGPHPRAGAPAVEEALDFFMRLGAIEPDGRRGHRTTALGIAWVKALCRTPMPRRVYVDASGAVLGGD